MNRCARSINHRVGTLRFAHPTLAGEHFVRVLRTEFIGQARKRTNDSFDTGVQVRPSASRVSERSPYKAQRNTGLPHQLAQTPEYAALLPGYGLVTALISSG